MESGLELRHLYVITLSLLIRLDETYRSSCGLRISS